MIAEGTVQGLAFVVRTLIVRSKSRAINFGEILVKFRGSSKRLHFQTVSDRAKFVLALYMVTMLVLYPSAAAVGSFFDH